MHKYGFSLLKWLIGLPFWAVQGAAETPENKKAPRRANFTGYYALEDISAILSAANVKLAAQGVNPLHEFEGGGGGMVVSVGPLVFDTGGTGGTSTIPSEGGVTEVSFGMGHLSFGPTLLQNRLWRVYPLVGIGGTGGTVENKAKTEGTEETKPAESSWGGFVMSMGLAIDFTLQLWMIGVLIGIRIGYYYSPVNVGVNMSEAEQKRPFFRLIIGPKFGG